MRKDGTRVPALVGASMLDSTNTRGICYALDMSQLRAAQARNLELKEELRQTQKLESVGKLAAGIAHDFNNLLNVIIGYACLIESKPDRNAIVGDQAKHILKAAEQASTLVRKLLAFGRKQLLKPEVLDLNAVLHEFEPLLHRLLGEKVKLLWECSPELWMVEVDANQMGQVLINLTVNAKDAMRDGGTVTIATANEDASGRVIMKVRDTGIGMTEYTKAHLFDPFYTTKGEGQGTGLGLSTVYGIITQSGGDITVRSQLGHGTEFSIYLPRTDKSLEGVPAVEHTFTPLRLETLVSKSRETVLLAEDEPDLRELLATLLKINGYDVLVAKDGEEAVVIAKTHQGPIQLLLTDIVMPRMNGVEAAQVIRTLKPSLRTIYMTGYAESMRSINQSCGCEVLLEKPVAPPVLFKKIREMLDAA
jgi:nitrogen-specific signal transduction histidine kinase/CheY-like chemotaxis protein